MFDPDLYERSIEIFREGFPYAITVIPGMAFTRGVMQDLMGKLSGERKGESAMVGSAIFGVVGALVYSGLNSTGLNMDIGDAEFRATVGMSILSGALVVLARFTPK